MVVESGVSRTTFVTTPRSCRDDDSGLIRPRTSSGASGVVRIDAIRRSTLIWAIQPWSPPRGPRYLGAGRTLWAQKLLFDDRNQVCAVVQTTSDPPWLYLPAEITTALRPVVSDIVEAIIEGIPRDVPVYAMPMEGRFGQGVRQGVTVAMHRFLDLPGTRLEALSPDGKWDLREPGPRRGALGAQSRVACWPPTAMAPASPSGRSRGSSTSRRCRPTCCSRSGSRSSPTSTRSRLRARRAMPRSSRSARGSSSGCGPICSRCSCAVTPATGVPRAWPRPSAGRCPRRWSSPSCPSRTSMDCAPPSGPRRWWPSVAPTSSSSSPPPRASAAVVSSTGRSPVAAPSSGPRGRGSGRASRSSSRPRPGRTASARPRPGRHLGRHLGRRR